MAALPVNTPRPKPNLVLLTDATGSMGPFLTSIKESLNQIIPMVQLTQAFDKIGLMAYRDYDLIYNVVDWSGWITSVDDAKPWLDRLTPGGGADTPEAVKTALVCLAALLDKQDHEISNNHFLVGRTPNMQLGNPKQDQQQETICLFFADAGAHADNSTSDNAKMERSRLPPTHQTWKQVTDALLARKVSFYPISNRGTDQDLKPIMELATRSHGVPKSLYSADTRSITTATINLLLTMLGHGDPKAYSPGHYIRSLTDITSIRPPSAMKTDPLYLDTVFAVFNKLLCVDSVMSLTTNPLFGTYWRALCLFREDPRRSTLTDQMGNLVPKLASHDRTVFQAWLDESYRNLDEIKNICDEAKSKYPALVLETNRKYKVQDVLEIGRSCNPETQAMVRGFLANIRIITDPTTPLPEIYIPLELQPSKLFTVLPHLMAEGATFTQRTAVILACIAAQSAPQPIAEKAKSFIEWRKGKWFKQDEAENYAPGFIRFILKDGLDSLDEKQVAELTQLRRLMSFTSNLQSQLDVVIPCVPSLMDLGPDRKQKCTACNEFRSPTLMQANGECVLHLLNDIQFSEFTETAPQHRSHWVECSDCTQHYAVIRPLTLGVRPKCYYCRLAVPNPPTPLKCSKCTNQFVNPSNTACPPDWVCERCVVAPASSFDTKQVSLQRLFDANQTAIRPLVGWNVDGSDPEKFKLSPFKLKTAFNPWQCDEEKFSPSMALTVNKKWIQNSAEVLEKIRTWIEKGKISYKECDLCCTPTHPNGLFPACNPKQCTSRLCADCLTAWYGETKPGSIVFYNHLLCPFCKNQPTRKLLKRFNPAALTLSKVNKEPDASYYHGWCVLCNKIEPAVPRNCAEDVPVLSKFRCEACIVITMAPDFTGKPCPSCKVPVLKTSGCDHITCQCNAHWCYQCGDAFDEREIYNHINKVHGDSGYEAMYENYDDEDNIGYGYV